MRKSLDLTKETDQLNLWRKLTRALKHVHKENNKNIEHIDEVDLETRRIAKFHLLPARKLAKVYIYFNTIKGKYYF